MSALPAGRTTASDVEHRQSPFYHIGVGEAIRTFDGKRNVTAGFLTEQGVFVKKMRNEHLLKRPYAIAIQKDVVDELARRDCVQIRAEIEGEYILTVLFTIFEDKGFLLDRGYGIQCALPLSHWIREDEEDEVEVQRAAQANIDRFVEENRPRVLAWLRSLPGLRKLRRVVELCRLGPDPESEPHMVFVLEMENGDTIPLGSLNDEKTLNARFNKAAGTVKLDFISQAFGAAEYEEV